MFLKSLHIEAFRGIDDLHLTFEPGITTFVGENDTGKSTVGYALGKVLRSQSLSSEDFPYGERTSGSVVASVELSSKEVQSLFYDHLVPDGNLDASPFLGLFLQQQGKTINLKIDNVSPRQDSVRWGEMTLTERNIIWFDRIGNTTNDWQQFSERMEASNGGAISQIRREGTAINPAVNLVSSLFAFVNEKYKQFEEFRYPSNPGHRGGETESMSGSEVASVLLTLRNHTDRMQRERYERIKSTFNALFPHYEIEAVEESPGQSIPEVQFYKGGRNDPLSLSKVSAGIHDILTFLTNLVAREDYLILVEHPETHLHPHAMRALNRLLLESSERNQLIIITHDPHFIDPSSGKRLRRFWWTPETGTRVGMLNTDISDRESAQVSRALRQLGDREMVFARAVLLVEDESLRDILIAVAPTLGYDLDSSGISVVFYGGHGGHKSYHTLLEGLGIPYINLRDKTWGKNLKFPQDRFFSLGMEFEEYADKNGLRELRSKIAKEVGGESSHRRVAQALGETLKKDQIPVLFDEVLGACMNLAT